MKFIQTFWTRNTAENDLLNISAGWLSPEYHWMSWALSCLQLKKIFGDIELVTDTNGKYILTELFKLPYARVYTPLDKVMDEYPPDLWALAKIYSYKIQQEPFLHFDSDFFLWEKPGQEILDAPIVSQNLEKDLPFYKNTLDELNKHIKIIPEPCQQQYYENKSIYACNAGIIGGNNLAFIKEYCQLAFDFVNANKQCFEFENVANVNFVIEQYFLYWLSEKRKLPITFLNDRVQEDPLYGSYVGFNDLPFVKLIHPVGGHKKSVEVCDHVAKKLRMEYPDYYYLILDTIQRKNKIARIKISYAKEKIRRRDNIYFSDRKNIFQRTIAALHYLSNQTPARQKKTALAIEKILSGESIEACKNYLENSPIAAQKRKLVLELYELETAKLNLYQQTFIKNKKTAQLYLGESDHYKSLQYGFAAPLNEIVEIKIKQNKNLTLIETTQNWTCKISALTDQMIKDKFETKENINAKFALVSKISRMEIDEYFLEPIDIIIVDFYHRKRNIVSLLNKMKDHFNKKDVQNNYPAFQNLIINTTKRLLYLEILKRQ